MERFQREEAAVATVAAAALSSRKMFNRVVSVSTVVFVWIFLVQSMDADATGSSVPWSATRSSSSSSDSPSHQCRRLVIGVDGGTESIRACCFDAVTGAVVGQSAAAPYPTHLVHPGWAEQDPELWWSGLGNAVRRAVASVVVELGDDPLEFCAMAVDTTCCSVVALDAGMRPLRPSLLWMDQRSAAETVLIMELARDDPALLVNNHGRGPISAEWMTPKALWMARHEPEMYQRAATLCEYQDFINYKLTGRLVANACNAATRWHWDGELACSITTTADDDDDDDDCGVDDTAGTSPWPGRPLSLYHSLGIPDLVQKLPSQCLPMGARIGTLTADAAKHLGCDGTILPVDLPVIQGGPDAFVGMVGLGCIQPGQLCLITGSSHLHCVVTSQPNTAPGIWGAYRGAPLPGLSFAEGGQSSSGSILRWARNLFGGSDSTSDSFVDYKALDLEASAVSPGADGLIALETFQGSRTPVTDPLARGALIGLTLSHTRGHIWRALMEAVCFGTRACMDGLAAAGHDCDEIILAGGVTNSDVWLQMHADVTGKIVTVCENSNAPLLGCAILASVGAGVHPSVPHAVRAMVRTYKQIKPNVTAVRAYDHIYKELYCNLADAVRPVAHAINKLRGGGYKPRHLDESIQVEIVVMPNDKATTHHRSQPVISPSLLACDWANMEKEVHRCLMAGLERFHVDVFDGVFLDSPSAFTFGPQMIRAIRQSCVRFKENATNPTICASLDLHMCVDRPARFVSVMAKTGGNCFIFQLEATRNVAEAEHLATQIAAAGMKCGVSLNPSTSLSSLYPLLTAGLVHVVDVLAVEPGFGGQRFQQGTLEKVSALEEWRRHHNLCFEIMVDGGMNEETSAQVIEAGADLVVAGTFLFSHPHGLRQGARDLVAFTREN